MAQRRAEAMTWLAVPYDEAVDGDWAPAGAASSSEGKLSDRPYEGSSYGSDGQA